MVCVQICKTCRVQGWDLQRFPQLYLPAANAAKYLQHKHIYIFQRLHRKEIALDSLLLTMGAAHAAAVPPPAVCVLCGFGMAKAGSSCKPFGSQMDLGVCYLCSQLIYYQGADSLFWARESIIFKRSCVRLEELASRAGTWKLVMSPTSGRNLLPHGGFFFPASAGESMGTAAQGSQGKGCTADTLFPLKSLRASLLWKIP